MSRLIIIAFCILVVSCSESQRDLDTAVNTCEDISMAQTIYSDAYKQMRAAALGNRGISDSKDSITTIFGCESITVDTLSNPRTIIIDYKFLSCEGMGVERFGRLKGEFFGKFGEEHSAVDITFANYFYQTNEIGGLLRIIFKENNIDGNEVHTFYVQGGSIYDGNSTMSWTASQNWVVLSETDVQQFEFTGTSNGMNKKGNAFFSEIKTKNTITDDCLYVGSGSLDLEVLNLSRRNLNFGSGICDKKAVATINGASHEVRLP